MNAFLALANPKTIACQTALPDVPNTIIYEVFKFDGLQSLQETQEEFMIKNVRMHTGWNRQGCILTAYSISADDVCVAIFCESHNSTSYKCTIRIANFSTPHPVVNVVNQSF